jgi:SAM-dependent methyltransferase
MKDPARCGAQRRAGYVASWPPDEFIVPLLKEWIETTIRTRLANDGRVRKVLDAGCGRQPFRSLIESLNGRYVGLDVHQSPEGTVGFIGAIDEQLPSDLLGSAPFNFLLCTEVLEHVANWPAAFDNFSRLLAKGGCLALTCPHFYQLHEEPYDFWRATSYSIEWHARRVGLIVERIERLGNAWDVLGGVLANMRPASIKERRTLPNRMLAGFMRGLFLRVLFPLLRRRWFHRRLDPRSSLYLANAAVIRKP